MTDPGMPTSRRSLWLRQAIIGPILMRVPTVLYWAAFLWRRLLFRTTIVAVAGSVGKTTTKELIAAVLAQRGRTYRTIANQNGGILIPLNVLRIRPWHRFAVIETSGVPLGVMQRTSRLLRPDIGVMLTLARTHTDIYPTLEDTAREKSKLFDHLSPRGIGLLNGDDPLVAAMAEKLPGRGSLFGTSDACALRAANVTSNWPQRLQFDAIAGGEQVPVRTRLVGEHWLPSVLAALAVGRQVGIPPRAAAEAISTVEPFRARLQPMALPNGAIVLRDDYQSTIDGSDAAFRVLAQARARRRILAITDLSDAGNNSSRRMRHIAAAAANGADMAVFIGRLAPFAQRRAIEDGMAPEAVHCFQTLRQAADFLRDELRAGDLLLLKGRSTDHVTRLFFHQFGTVECWKSHCSKTTLCDECWELGVSKQERALVRPAP